MLYDIVIYKCGASIYYKASNDNAIIKPNVPYIIKHTLDYETPLRNSKIFYIYRKRDPNYKPISPIFTNIVDCDYWRRCNGLLFGVDVYIRTCHNNEYYVERR